MSHGWLVSPGLPLALAVIGTLGLAYSWDVQNRELISAVDDTTRLQRSQLVIDIDEISRDQWLIALDQEIAKEKPNADLLAVTAHGALEATLQWQSHMKGRVADSQDEYRKQLAERDLILEQAEKVAESKNYRALVAALEGLTTDARGLTAELDEKFSVRVDAANHRVTKAESRMRTWYFVATAFLLLSSILASVFLELTLRRVTEAQSRSPSAKSQPPRKRK